MIPFLSTIFGTNGLNKKINVSFDDNFPDLHSENNGVTDIKCFYVTPIHIYDIRGCA